MTVTVAPATIFDLAAIAGYVSALEWRILREMFWTGETFAVHARGGLIVVGNLYPLDKPGILAEATFAAVAEDNPTRGLASARPHMLAVARAIRLTLAASSYAAILTETRTDAGRRLARAAGFHRTGLPGASGEKWVYGSSDRRGGPQAGTGPAAAG